MDLELSFHNQGTMALEIISKAFKTHQKDFKKPRNHGSVEISFKKELKVSSSSSELIIPVRGLTKVPKSSPLVGSALSLE